MFQMFLPIAGVHCSCLAGKDSNVHSYNSLDGRYRYRGVQRDPWMLMGGSTCVHGCVSVYVCVRV